MSTVYLIFPFGLCVCVPVARQWSRTECFGRGALSIGTAHTPSNHNKSWKRTNGEQVAHALLFSGWMLRKYDLDPLLKRWVCFGGAFVVVVLHPALATETIADV